MRRGGGGGVRERTLDAPGGAIDAGSASELNSYDDRNFYARTEDGTHAYTLKVHNGVESARPGLLSAQTAMMRHLQAHDVPAPVPMRTNASLNFIGSINEKSKRPVHDDVAYLELPQASGEIGARRLHAVRVLTWLPGEIAERSARVRHTPEFLRDVGAFLGKNGERALELLAPGRRTRPPVGFENVRDARPFAEAIEDSENASIASSVLDAFETIVTPHACALRSGVAHGDANDQNVLVRVIHPSVADDFFAPGRKPVAPKAVPCGILDFGDIVTTWRVNEVAVAAAYFALGSEDPVGSVAEIVTGFERTFPLTATERRVLPTLVAARLVCSCALGAYSASLDPENEAYLLLTQKPGWTALRHMRDIGDEAFASGSTRRAEPTSAANPSAGPSNGSRRGESTYRCRYLIARRRARLWRRAYRVSSSFVKLFLFVLSFRHPARVLFAGQLNHGAAALAFQLFQLSLDVAFQIRVGLRGHHVHHGVLVLGAGRVGLHDGHVDLWRDARFDLRGAETSGDGSEKGAVVQARGRVNARVVRRNAVVELTTNLSRLQLLITRQVVPELEFLLLLLRTLAKRMEAFLALLRGLAHRARRTCGLGLPFDHSCSAVAVSRRKSASRREKVQKTVIPRRARWRAREGGMSPPPVPLRARLTAVAGALILTPDTALMRLTKMQTSSRWYTAWGIVLWRGAVRAVLLPPLWMVIKGESPRAFARDARDLGWRRLCGGALLYTIQNVAFIIAANLTYIASVLAILATGPLMSCFAAKAFLGDPSRGTPGSPRSSAPRACWCCSATRSSSDQTCPERTRERAHPRRVTIWLETSSRSSSPRRSLCIGPACVGRRRHDPRFGAQRARRRRVGHRSGLRQCPFRSRPG